MATNPFKSFFAFSIVPQRRPDQWTDGTVDPSGGSWRSIGFVPPIPGDPELLVDLQGVGRLACIRFNERILPGKVRDEELSKRVKKYLQTEDKIDKKTYAQMRDQVEFDLLPRAFIRRSSVYVFFKKDLLLVFTSSQKRCDDVISLLMGNLGADLSPFQHRPQIGLSGQLTSWLKRNCEPIESEDTGDLFEVDHAVVLKGEDKKSVRMKDIDLDFGPVEELLKDNDFRVTELRMAWRQSVNHEDVQSVFVVTEHMGFKAVEIPGVKFSVKDDFFGFVVLQVQNTLALLAAFIGSFGPLGERDDEQDRPDDGEI